MHLTCMYKGVTENEQRTIIYARTHELNLNLAYVHNLIVNKVIMFFVATLAKSEVIICNY